MPSAHALIVALLVAASPPAAGKEGNMANQGNQDSLRDWRDQKLELLSKSLPMTPVPTDPKYAIDRALWSSMDWCRWVLVPRADPWQPDNRGTHAYRVADAAAPDLLEHKLAVRKVPVRILEGSSFMLIIVSGTALPGSDPLEKAAQAAKLVLRLGAPATFKPVASDTRFHSFSTNEALPLGNVSEWQERIDGMISQGDVALLVLKITLDRMMDIVSNSREWFHELRGAPRP